MDPLGTVYHRTHSFRAKAFLKDEVRVPSEMTTKKLCCGLRYRLQPEIHTHTGFGMDPSFCTHSQQCHQETRHLHSATRGSTTTSFRVSPISPPKMQVTLWQVSPDCGKPSSTLRRKCSYSKALRFRPRMPMSLLLCMV